MVVSMKNPASQFDQLSVITQQQQVAHPRFRTRHKQWPNPVPCLQQRLLIGKTQLMGEIKPIFPNHQGERSAEVGSSRNQLKCIKAGAQLIGRGTRLHLRLRANQSQTIHHAKRCITRSLRELTAERKHNFQLQTSTRSN